MRKINGSLNLSKLPPWSKNHWRMEFPVIPICPQDYHHLIIISRVSCSRHHYAAAAATVSSAPSTHQQPAVRASHASLPTWVHHRRARMTHWRTDVTQRSLQTRHLHTIIKQRVFIYRHLCTMYISKRSGTDHTVLPANTPCLPFLHKHSPDGATSDWGVWEFLGAGVGVGVPIF